MAESDAIRALEQERDDALAQVDRLRAERDHLENRWRDEHALRKTAIERADRAEAERDAARAELERLQANAHQAAEKYHHTGQQAIALHERNSALTVKLEAAERDRDRLAEQVKRVKQVRAWRNEDGRMFVFASDLRAALDGAS
jgi:predicted nuclease with TOPRIM domain